MAYTPKNPNGQASMANSSPVVVASDQSAVPVSAASLPLPSGASTSAKQPALGTAGTASTDVITVQGIASGTAQPVSGTVSITANSAVNVAQVNGVTTLMGNGVTGTGSQRVTVASDNTPFPVKTDQTTHGTTDLVAADVTKIAGTTADTNSGTKSAGTLRVVLATDQPALTNKLLVTPDSVALPANQSVNVAQINGVTTTMGNGVSGTGVQRVTIASDSTGNIATIGTSVTPGTAAANLGKAEDAAHTTGDVGVMALGVRNDTLAIAVTNASGDYSQVSTDTSGRMMVASAPRSLKGMAQVQLSNTTTETTILAATASTFHDIYGIILANTGATTTKVSLRDDTAGTVRAIIEVPTLETRGFMLTVDSAVPQTAVNKNWTAQCASATTALEVTLFYVNMLG